TLRPAIFSVSNAAKETVELSVAERKWLSSLQRVSLVHRLPSFIASALRRGSCPEFVTSSRLLLSLTVFKRRPLWVTSMALAWDNHLVCTCSIYPSTTKIRCPSLRRTYVVE